MVLFNAKLTLVCTRLPSPGLSTRVHSFANQGRSMYGILLPLLVIVFALFFGVVSGLRLAFDSWATCLRIWGADLSLSMRL